MKATGKSHSVISAGLILLLGILLAWFLSMENEFAALQKEKDRLIEKGKGRAQELIDLKREKQAAESNSISVVSSSSAKSEFELRVDRLRRRMHGQFVPVKARTLYSNISEINSDLIGYPVYAKAAASLMRYKNDITYTRVFKIVEERGIDIEKVKSLLVDYAMTGIEGVSLRVERVRQIHDRPTIIATVAETEVATSTVQNDIDKELLALVGDDIFAQLKYDYPKIRIDEFQQRLETNLNDDQYMKLAELLVNNQPNARSEFQIEADAIAQARAFLRPEQYDELKRFVGERNEAEKIRRARIKK